MVKDRLDTEDVFRSAKWCGENTSKEMQERLDKIDERLQAKFVVTHKQQRRIVAQTLLYARTHTVS